MLTFDNLHLVIHHISSSQCCALLSRTVLIFCVSLGSAFCTNCGSILFVHAGSANLGLANSFVWLTRRFLFSRTLQQDTQFLLGVRLNSSNLSWSFCDVLNSSCCTSGYICMQTVFLVNWRAVKVACRCFFPLQYCSPNGNTHCQQFEKWNSKSRYFEQNKNSYPSKWHKTSAVHVLQNNVQSFPISKEYGFTGVKASMFAHPAASEQELVDTGSCFGSWQRQFSFWTNKESFRRKQATRTNHLMPLLLEVPNNQERPWETNLIQDLNNPASFLQSKWRSLSLDYFELFFRLNAGKGRRNISEATQTAQRYVRVLLWLVLTCCLSPFAVVLLSFRISSGWSNAGCLQRRSFCFQQCQDKEGWSTDISSWKPPEKKRILHFVVLQIRALARVSVCVCTYVRGESHSSPVFFSKTTRFLQSENSENCILESFEYNQHFDMQN